MPLSYPENLVVLTGGPGAGKTTLINYLNTLGYETSPEIARNVIETQQKQGGTALPWQDNEAYCRLMTEGSMRAWQVGMALAPVTVFFDRGLPDALAHRRLYQLPEDSTLNQVIKTCRYRQTVFILPPWPEIYQTDTARKQSLAEAIKTYDVLHQTYLDCGYTPVEIAKGPVEQRAEQILTLLSR
ncbi:AAA family ATPase [Thalassospira sp. TSL5-1]|uniref:AAA family ATPase n=1 Tax=Thalassospira sp. TSL5-1 TaxID=1544451 RepID=UPI00093DB68B|nr:AAA family ATPase [Thalassospira sp. TSL5-1]OKH87104.1 ATPase [Thalassospira sp. TSL5-1]